MRVQIEIKIKTRKDKINLTKSPKIKFWKLGLEKML